MKCLDQQGLKYLWSLIEAKFATNDEVTSKCNAVSSALTTQINNHTGNTDNPHNVTKAQLGLGDFTYEEGTWTPSLYTTKNSPTYYANEGIYKKVGNMVFCWGCLRLSNISALEIFNVKGLPYAVLSAYGHGTSSEGNLSAAQTTLKNYNGAPIGERDLGIYVSTNNRISVSTPGDNQHSVYIGSDSNEQYALYMNFWYMTNGTKL